jgi:hypothetical protein
MLLFLLSQSNVTDILSYITIIFTTKPIVQPNKVRAIQISLLLVHLHILE